MELSVSDFDKWTDASYIQSTKSYFKAVEYTKPNKRLAKSIKKDSEIVSEIKTEQNDASPNVYSFMWVMWEMLQNKMREKYADIIAKEVHQKF